MPSEPPAEPIDPRSKIADFRLPDFLEEQMQAAGGNVEIEPAGLWLLFVIAVNDEDTNAFARSLLADVRFPYDSGVSADDQWALYYVETAHRAAAVHWLQDLQAQVKGELRPVSPEHRAMIRELGRSAMPHRIAMQLAEAHARGELTAGCINDRALIRVLVDRWHLPGPIHLPTFRTLLAHHLIDLIVLLDEISSEDIDVLNDLMQESAATDDPGTLSRRAVAAELRQMLMRMHVINSLDWQKNTAITNPYASYVDLSIAEDRVVAPVDNVMVRVSRDHFRRALLSVRKQLYCGEQFSEFDTLAPWITNATALPFRFLKQRLAVHRDLAPLDWLYFIDRVV